MFQILFLGIDFSKIAYGIVRGLYGTVAKVYDLMIGLVHSTSTFDFSDFVQSIYVIAGVFMLFRIAISMIGMIANPDQINDKNVGAGKLLSRVILVIILLMVFAPDGFLLRKPSNSDEGGLLARVQDAIIGEDGFLDNFAPETYSEYDDYGIETDVIYSDNSLLYENVYAAESSKTCYFFNKTHITNSNKGGLTSGCGNICSVGNKNYSSAKCNECKNQNKSEKYGSDTTYYKIKFYDANSSNKQGVKISLKSEMTAQVITETQSGFTFSNLNIGKELSNNITEKSVKNCENWGISIIGDMVQIRHNPEKTSSVFIGYNSLDALAKALNKDIEKNYGEYVEQCEEYPDDPQKCSPTVKEILNSKNSWLPSVSNEAIGFATNVVSSFQDCENGSKTCEDAKKAQFGNVSGISAKDGGEKIIDLMKDDKLSLDFLLSLIAGVVLIAFIVILCVDVVVRNLKLALLEMIAPIAIISYTDPKDKVFGTWLKTYFSVFVDLFIKLLAIKLVLILISKIGELEVSGIEYFFVIVAILVFAKMVPSMISKIFGLELGSSFKDITNMVKSGAGFAAGAAIGGAVGLATGKGFGRVTGALGGALRGAGSGSKGKVLGGAQSIAAKNAKVNQQKADGLGFMDRLAVGVAGATGITLAGKKAEQQMKAAKTVGDANKALKDYALGEVQKKGHVMDANTVKGFVASNKNKAGNNGIFAKDDDNKLVAGGSKDQALGIDMKREYNNLDMLNSMSADDYVKSTNKITDSNGSVIGTYQEALRFQQQRIAALEDFAVADRINTDGGVEMKQMVSNYNDAVGDARVAGIAENKFSEITQGKVNSKTLSQNKDAAIQQQLDIGHEYENELKRQKYVDNK